MEKILIVDDEVEICNAMRDFFKMKDFDVYTALNGPSAIHVVKEVNPQIILLDVVMPGMNGIETLKQIKEINPSAAVIMVTAVLDEELGNFLLKLGAFDYITKPVDLDYLESVVMVKILDLISES